MVLLKIKIEDKTYTALTVKMYISKEALRIQRDTMAFAQREKDNAISKDDLDGLELILAEVDALNDRKVALICEAYGNKFTADAVEKSLSIEEVNEQVNKILSATSGVISKN